MIFEFSPVHPSSGENFTVTLLFVELSTCIWCPYAEFLAGWLFLVLAAEYCYVNRQSDRKR
jgi:hypothetical protein